jgi:hypothetical protein
MTTEKGPFSTRPFPRGYADGGHADVRPAARAANDLPELPREDLAAGLQARRELGPEYDAAFAESLLDRVEETIQARLGGRPVTRSELEQVTLLRLENENARGERKVTVSIAVVSLIASIPLTGIAAGMHSFGFLVIIWTGLVMINLAHAVRRPKGH